MNRLTQYARNLRPIELSANPGPTELDELEHSLKAISDKKAYYANDTSDHSEGIEWYCRDSEDEPWTPDLLPYSRLANYSVQRKIIGTQRTIGRRAVFNLDHTLIKRTGEGKAIVRLRARNDEMPLNYYFAPELAYDPNDVAHVRDHSLALAVEGLRRLASADETDFRISQQLDRFVSKREY